MKAQAVIMLAAFLAGFVFVATGIPLWVMIPTGLAVGAWIAMREEELS